MLRSVEALPPKRYILTIFCAALFMRLAVVFTVGQLYGLDMYEPYIISQNIINGHGFAMHWPYESFDAARYQFMQTQPPPYVTTFMPPLVPYFYSGYFMLFGVGTGALQALLMIQAVIGSLLPLLLFGATRSAFGESAGRWAGIICVLYLPVAMTAVTLSGAALYAPMFVGVVWSAVRVYKRFDTLGFILLGVTSGLLSLLRSEFYYIFFVLVAAIILAWGRKYPAAARIRAIAFCCMAFALATGWWTVRNYREFGRFIPVTGHPWREIWRGYNPYSSGSGTGANHFKIWENKVEFAHITRALDSIDYDAHFEGHADKIYKREVIGYVQAQPGSALWLAFKKVVMLWTIDVYYEKARHPLYVIPSLAVFALCSAGLYYLLRRKEYRALWPLWGALFVCYTGVFVLTYVLPRYQSFIYPAFFPLAGYACAVWLSSNGKHPANTAESTISTDDA